jgi:ribosomal protein S6
MAKNKDTDVIVDETEDTGAEPRVYELGFHLDPELPVEGVKKAYQAIREFVTSNGTIVAEVEPEKIQLAYTISRQEVAGRRDFDSAYFAWIVYETVATNHTEIITMMSANTSIVRFIDLVTDKETARHALEAHELAQKSAPIEQDIEQDAEALGAELDVALESAAL